LAVVELEVLLPGGRLVAGYGSSGVTCLSLGASRDRRHQTTMSAPPARELGHVLNVLPGDKDPSVNRNNTLEVLKHCF